jgi:hypothetical protein
MANINGNSNGASKDFWDQVSKYATDKASGMLPHHAIHILKALSSVGLVKPDLLKVDQL